MNKFVAFFKSFFFPNTTVAGVMSDFNGKVKQLEKVVAYQKKEQAKKAEAIAKAVKAQDNAQAEAHRATNTIAALKAITEQTNQITLADLKKEI